MKSIYKVSYTLTGEHDIINIYFKSFEKAEIKIKRLYHDFFLEQEIKFLSIEKVRYTKQKTAD